MPFNRAYIDLDVVKPTKYIVPPTRIAKEPPLEPWELPKFKPYVIDDYNAHGEPNLPNYVDTSAPLELFKLFFTDKMMDKLVEWLNDYTEAHVPSDEDALMGRACPWQPISREELYAYFRVLIHMGITSESAIEDYWGSLDLDSCLYIVKNYISKNRF